MKRKIDIALTLFVFILAVFTIVYCVPVISGVIISFTDWNGISPQYSFVGFDNYIKMFSDERMKNAVGVTLRYLILLLSSTLFLGYIMAQVVRNSKHIRTAKLFLTFFPYVVTPVIVCIMWNQVFINLIPQIGKWLDIDFLETNLLANSSTALWAVVFVDLWMLVPYAMLLMLSALNSIPKDLLEYAKLEQASKWKIFRYIEFSYLLPTIGMISTIIVSYALTHVDTLMVLTAGGPGRSTETMYYIVYKNSTMEQRYSYGLAEGIVVALVSIVAFVLINKLTNSQRFEGISYDGENRDEE